MFVIRDFWPTALLLPQFKLAKKFARYSELSRRARVDKAASKGAKKPVLKSFFVQTSVGVACAILFQ